jgi:hypothetical protein
MPSGKHLTRRDRERVWRLVSGGCRNLHAIADQTGLCYLTVRAVVYDACGELVTRLDWERACEEIDRMCGGE